MPPVDRTRHTAVRQSHVVGPPARLPTVSVPRPWAHSRRLVDRAPLGFTEADVRAALLNLSTSRLVRGTRGFVARVLKTITR